MPRHIWTVEQIVALGVTTDVPTAADILSISRSHAYNLARQDTFPVPLVRIGTRVIVPVAGLLELLRIRLEAVIDRSVHGTAPADWYPRAEPDPPDREDHRL